MDNRPIGVFDSGVGGLTVVNALMQSISNEIIYYVGDTARVPYGNKSKERVQQYSEEIIEWLIQKDCKMIVIACNTASSLAIDYLSNKFTLPIIGVIDPGVNCAIATTKNQSIGIIGTHATIQSDSYGKRLKSINPEVQIINQACPLFVPLVEEGLIEGRVPTLIAKSYLDHFTNTDVDTIILGCTHYPILEKTIRNILGDGINLVDSGKVTAEVVSDSLKENRLLSNRVKGEVHSFVTDSKKSFEEIVTKSLYPVFDIGISSTTRIDIN